MGKGVGRVPLPTPKLFFCSIPAGGGEDTAVTTHPPALVLLVVEPLVNCVGKEKK